MAATFVNFTPSTQSVFSFQAQIGGSQYTVTVTWNLVGQRYYVTVSDLNGTVIVTRPLISCGPQLPAAFSWDDSGTATATTTSPHNVPLGSVANIYASQTESGFDGAYQMLATGPNTLTYPLATDPSQTGPLNGAINFIQNMVSPQIPGGYLLFRYETQQFEFG